MNVYASSVQAAKYYFDLLVKSGSLLNIKNLPPVNTHTPESCNTYSTTSRPTFVLINSGEWLSPLFLVQSQLFLQASVFFFPLHWHVIHGIRSLGQRRNGCFSLLSWFNSGSLDQKRTISCQI